MRKICEHEIVTGEYEGLAKIITTCAHTLLGHQQEFYL